MKCTFCGAENPDSADKCSVCRRKLNREQLASGESYKRTPEFYGRVQPMIPDTKTMAPIAAGAILTINAILSLGGLWITNIYVGEFHPESIDAMAPVNLVFGGLGLFVLIGGILAMLRKMWPVCLVASIASFFLTLAFGLFCGVVQAMLSIAALVFLIQSRKEFSTSRARGQP